METEYIVIRPDGTEEKHTANLPEEPDYEQIKAIMIQVFGPRSWFERVAVLHDGKRTDMFVDEEGLLKRLPRNEKATAIYRANWLAQHPATDPEELNLIVGTAVLFTRPVWF